jgi:hypothetical protein
LSGGTLIKKLLDWLEAIGLSKKTIAWIAIASIALVVIAREVYGLHDSQNLFVGFVFLFGCGAAIFVALKAMRKMFAAKPQ